MSKIDTQKLSEMIKSKRGSMGLREVAKEIGDVLWYLAVFADHLGISLNAVAQQNLDKLKSRQARGVLGGTGDNR